MHKLDDGDCDADHDDSTADSGDKAFVESLHPLAVAIVSLRLENFTCGSSDHFKMWSRSHTAVHWLHTAVMIMHLHLSSC